MPSIVRAGPQSWAGLCPGARASVRCIWLHAVSVGEVNLLQSLLRELPPATELDYVITTTTKAGYDLARRKYSQHLVSYCPFDFSWAVRSALRRFRPSLLVLSELELWPNLIRESDRRRRSRRDRQRPTERQQLPWLSPRPSTDRPGLATSELDRGANRNIRPAICGAGGRSAASCRDRFCEV